MYRRTFLKGTMHLSAALLAIALLVSPAGWAESADLNRVDKISTKSFSDTLDTLETALKGEGMMIVAKIDLKNMLSMLGARIKGATIIQFGKPAMDKMLLPMNTAIGLEMPPKIYVYESGDGKVVVSYRKMAPGFATYGSPEVAKAGEMMDMMLDKLASAATE